MLPNLERFLSLRPDGFLACGLTLILQFPAPANAAATVTLVRADAKITADCTAHVVSDGEAEVSAPCGSPAPATGRHRAGWIETRNEISPFLTDVSHVAEARIDRLVPAGTVTFPPDALLAPRERIRLLSLVSAGEDATARRLFVRDVQSLTTQPKMPAGEIVAFLIDPEGRVTAVSRPVRIHAGVSNVVWPAIDRAGASLVAWLERPGGFDSGRNDRLSVAGTGSKVREPGALVNASDALVAVWYGLEDGPAMLVLESAKSRLESGVLELSRGSVVMARQPLLPLPTLTVTVTVAEAPTELPPLTLTIARASDEAKQLRSVTIEPGRSYPIGPVPAAPLTVDLQIGTAVWSRIVDLTSGKDTNLDIALNPLRISGSVYFGSTPARASVRFAQKGEALVVDTDDRGSYEVILWEPRRYIVDTTLTDQPSMYPFSQQVRITSSETLDIHVPANTLRAHVYDTATQRPIDGARILLQNRWLGDYGSESTVMTVPARGQLTTLPPQRVGTTEIRVDAPGYEAAGPLTIPIEASTGEQTIDIPMTPSAEAPAPLVISIDGVAPAAGAEIGAWAEDRLLWLGTADSAGRISVPDSVMGRRVIVRHPEAATDVIVFGKLEGEQRLSLSMAAPPLLIRAVDRQGRAIGPAGARVSLWLSGGVRLSGPEAAFATWSLGATSPDGSFVAKGLRPKPLRILITRNATAQQIATGTFDALATTIPFPWPAVAEVKAGD